MLSPIPAFSRLIVTGNDRVKYLHNFCTNNIKELPSGNACEAFFCDVKARVLAHGYVLAFDDCHEIWMLAGDEPGILKHLSRYIITEDVTIRSDTQCASAVAAIGSASAEAFLNGIDDAGEGFQQPLTCARLQIHRPDGSSATTTALSVTWSESPMLWLATSTESGVISTAAEADGAESEFERLRIRERFPIINQDLSIENMAPEAERNSTAISYVKGCYLGQEPIARLDAMGHVNRALQCLESSSSASSLLRSNVLAADGTIAGVITSAAPMGDGSVGLALIRSSAMHGPLHCLIDGQNVVLKV